MASSPLSCRAAKREQVPQQQAVALRCICRWGERLWRMRRERTLQSAQDNQRGNASTTIDAGASGGLTRDVTVLVILVH